MEHIFSQGVAKGMSQCNEATLALVLTLHCFFLLGSGWLSRFVRIGVVLKESPKTCSCKHGVAYQNCNNVIKDV